MFYIYSWNSLCESGVNNQVKNSIGKCTIYSKISDQKFDYFTFALFQKKKEKKSKENSSNLLSVFDRALVLAH